MIPLIAGGLALPLYLVAWAIFHYGMFGTEKGPKGRENNMQLTLTAFFAAIGGGVLLGELLKSVIA
jgi:hypothetical protein